MAKNNIVDISYGITTSKEGNACLYMDITKRKGKVTRFLGKGAINIAEKILISHKMKEMWELKEYTDKLYLSNNK